VLSLTLLANKLELLLTLVRVGTTLLGVPALARCQITIKFLRGGTCEIRFGVEGVRDDLSGNFMCFIKDNVEITLN
jgi:hypothetical protein